MPIASGHTIFTTSASPVSCDNVRHGRRRIRHGDVQPRYVGVDRHDLVYGGSGTEIGPCYEDHVLGMHTISVGLQE